MDEQTLFIQHEALVWKVVRSFTRRNNNLDEFELFGQAQIFALHAIRTFDASQSKLSTWIGRIVRQGLIGLLRRKHGQGLMLHRQEFAEWSGDIANNAAFNLRSFRKELSNDAQVAIDITMGFQGEFVNQSNCVVSFVRSLVHQSIAELGWSAAHTKKVFNEIREALQ